MVHVTKTEESGDWTEFERTVLQVAKPHIEAKYGWNIDQGLLDLSHSSLSRAVVTQSGMSGELGGVSLDQATAEPWAFALLMDMGTWDVDEVSSYLPCKDIEAGQSYLQVQQFLQRYLGVPEFTCGMVSNTSLCSEMDMAHVRSLCP